MTNAHPITLAPRIVWEERTPELWTGKVTSPAGVFEFDFHVMKLRSGLGWISRILGDMGEDIPIQTTAALARASSQRWLDRRALERLSTPALACLIDILSNYAEGNSEHFIGALHTARDELFARHEAMKERNK